MSMSEEKTNLNVLVSTVLKKELQKLAEADRRNLSQYVNVVLEEHVSMAQLKAASHKRGQK